MIIPRYVCGTLLILGGIQIKLSYTWEYQSLEQSWAPFGGYYVASSEELKLLTHFSDNDSWHNIFSLTAVILLFVAGLSTYSNLTFNDPIKANHDIKATTFAFLNRILMVFGKKISRLTHYWFLYRKSTDEQALKKATVLFW